jgi:hypothetical protein
MTNKRNWLGILAIVLVFGITVVGCDNDPTNENNNENGADTWTAITSLSQLNGTWKGKSPFLWGEGEGDASGGSEYGIESVGETTITISVTGSNLIIHQSGTFVFNISTWGNITEASVWASIKNDLQDPDNNYIVTAINDTNHTVTMSFTEDWGAFSIAELFGDFGKIEKNQTGNKLRFFQEFIGEYVDEAIILVKQ